MNDSRFRVLLVCSHPVQHEAPLFRLMRQHPRLDPLVAYCSLPDSRLWQDPEFLTQQAFDLPTPEGYPWICVPNRALMPRLGKFFGLVNPNFLSLARRKEFDCCVVYGYSYASFWFAIAAAKSSRIPLVVTTDATYLEPLEGQAWKKPLKRKLLPRICAIADVILVPSTASRLFLGSLGIADDRIVVTPYVVDNQRIASLAAASDRRITRREWQIPEDATVVLFCSKFLRRKRPGDLLAAFASARVPNSYLVFAGDGPLRFSLQSDVEQLGLTNAVRFLGLVKYAHLPAVYAASDVLVLPSEHEPWGLAVNEAMVCGRPVIVSDRVGSHYDLVEQDKTGWVYRCGDRGALAAILREVLPSRPRLTRMGEAARQRMETWSYRENLEGFVSGVERAIRFARGDAAA